MTTRPDPALRTGFAGAIWIKSPSTFLGSYYWKLAAAGQLFYCPEQGFKLCESAETELVEEMQY